MGSMFRAAEKFDQPLNSWETLELTNINNMFRDVKKFNQPLSNWDIVVLAS